MKNVFFYKTVEAAILTARSTLQYVQRKFELAIFYIALLKAFIVDEMKESGVKPPSSNVDRIQWFLRCYVCHLQLLWMTANFPIGKENYEDNKWTLDVSCIQ